MVAVGVILFLLVCLTATKFKRSCGSVSHGSLQLGSSPGLEMTRHKALDESLVFDWVVASDVDVHGRPPP